MKKIFICFIFLLSFNNCETSVNKGVESSSTISLKDAPFLKGITRITKIVPLETTAECLIQGVNKIMEWNDFIFVQGQNILYKFSKKGLFLSKLSKPGRGPGEYINLDDFTIGDSKVFVNDSRGRKFIVYNLNFELLFEISMPNIFATKFQFFNENLVLFTSTIGQKDVLVSFNLDSETINSCLPREDDNPELIPVSINAPFQLFDGSLLYLNQSDNRIYEYKTCDEVQVKYRIDLSKYDVNHQEFNMDNNLMQEIQKFDIVWGYFETSSHILISYKDHKIQFNNSLIVDKSTGNKTTAIIEDVYNLKYEISDLCYLAPRNIIDDEFVIVLSHYHIDNLLDHSSLPSELKNITISDNPILVFYKIDNF